MRGGGVRIARVTCNAWSASRVASWVTVWTTMARPFENSETKIKNDKLGTISCVWREA